MNIKGFFEYIYGQLWWYLTGGVGCRLMILCTGRLGKIGEWLVSQYGYARTPNNY